MSLAGAGKVASVRSLTLEIQAAQFHVRVAVGPRRLIQDRGGTESGVFPTRGPRQVAERLETAVAGERVHEISGLHATDQGQDLRRRKVERMECEARVVVLHQRKEAVRAVAGPLDEDHFTAATNLGLHESQTLAKYPDRISRALQRNAIGLPRHGQRFLSVVEQIEVAGEPRRSEQFVECRSFREIALAAAQSVLR